jgi:hypothetical protein
MAAIQNQLKAKEILPAQAPPRRSVGTMIRFLSQIDHFAQSG